MGCAPYSARVFDLLRRAAARRTRSTVVTRSFPRLSSVAFTRWVRAFFIGNSRGLVGAFPCTGALWVSPEYYLA
jgi:hypothetical protein